MKKTLLSFIVMFLTLQAAFAQRQVTGTVRGGDNNVPLIGASVLVTGTKIGAITDVNGKFSVSVSETASTIQVSFIGYEKQDVSIKGVSDVQITLAYGKELSEVVVVGYTSQRKQDLTGSVVVVDLKPIVRRQTKVDFSLRSVSCFCECIISFFSVQSLAVFIFS